MFNIFNFGKIKLLNGASLTPINIKKNYNELMELYNKDPNEFRYLQFLQAENFTVASSMFKEYTKAKNKGYLILDNDYPVGVIEFRKNKNFFYINTMIDFNYGQSYAIKLAINYFIQKHHSKNEIFLNISNYETNLINELKAFGIETNILYLVSGKSFVFFGNDYENIRENDLQEVDESFSYVQFFSNNWSGQNAIAENNFSQDNNQDYYSQNEQWDQQQEQYDENQAYSQDQYYDPNDEINIDEQNIDDQSNYLDQPLISNQLINKPLDNNDFVSQNIVNTMQEIAKIPETEKYSKTNGELFEVIRNTPTFKDFQDSSIRDIKLKQKSNSSIANNNPRIAMFKQKLADIKARRESQSKFGTSKYVFDKSKSAEEEKEFFKTEHLNFEEKSDFKFGPIEHEKTDAPKRKGFGSRVMSI